MEYANLAGLSKPLSRIVYGTSSPAFAKGEDMGAILDEAVKLGITTFDTARYYGEAENTLGKWTASRGNRDRVVILSKGGHPALFIPRLNARAIRNDLCRSLEALQTDRIDIYLLHRDSRRPAGEYVELLNEFHADGKIGAFGGSNWTHERIEEANEYAYRKNLIPFTVSSPYFGLADMKGDPFGNGAVGISGPKNQEAQEWYRKNGMAVFSYSSLAGGFFSGKVKKPSDLHGWRRRGFATKENFERLRRCEELAQKKGCTAAQLALSWLFGCDMNLFAVLTASDPVHLKQNVGALAIPLSKEEADYLDLRTDL